MEKLLATYLFQHKICPLPTVGTLVVRTGNAQVNSVEKKISAPIPFIEYSDQETSTVELTHFIARYLNVGEDKAAAFLNHYCTAVNQLQASEELGLATVGSFYKDEQGVLHFKSAAIPAAFLPEVAAERVIHADAAHHIMVGDTQTNTVAMSEFLNQEQPIKNRWLIAALVLYLIGFLLIFYYYSRHPEGGFGNETRASSSVITTKAASASTNQ
jgi:hypothetical protein